MNGKRNKNESMRGFAAPGYDKSGAVKKRKKLRTADIGLAERFKPSADEGLTAAQVQSRIDGDYTNAVKAAHGKSYGSIIMSNLFTYLNMLTIGIFIAIIATAISAGQSDFLWQCLFVIIIVINTVIGITQECRAKYSVDRLKLVIAPTAVVVRGGDKRAVPVGEVVLDDIIYLEAGKQIAADAVVVRGESEVNESMITGESVAIAKRVGDTIYSGSYVSAGSCYARVDKVGSANYIETLTSYAKRYKKPKSELHNSIRLIIQIVSVIMVPIAIGLVFTNFQSLQAKGLEGAVLVYNIVKQVAGALIGMIPTGMFLLTSVALFTSERRLAKRRTLVQDLNCIEMLARVDTLCLDKTGTITDGSMKVNNVIEFRGGSTGYALSDIIGSMLSATEDNNQTAIALADKYGYNLKFKATAVLPFSSQRKLSAVTFDGMGTYILGAPEFVLSEPGVRIQHICDENAAAGYRVMCLAHSAGELRADKLPGVRRPVCLIVIEDHIRDDAYDTIRWFRENDVAVKVISGDNPKTVSEVARRVGVENADKYISLDGLSPTEVIEAANKYTVFGRVTPEQKSLLVKSIKSKGHTVAMTGDGVNDILAMRQADCAISIASGTDAAKNVAHLVLLDNDFTSMPDVVVEGRRVINNVAKSSSLFLMKTFMSVILSVVTLVMGVQYFYTTNMLMLLEFFVIGIPSFFLALQTNTNRIEGKYILNVLKNSVPGGVALVINSVMCYVFCRFAHGMDAQAVFNHEFSSLLVLSLFMTGFVMLIQLCLPLNVYRSFMLIGVLTMSIVVIVAGSSLGGFDLFGFTFSDISSAHALENWLFLGVIVMFQYFLASGLRAALVKIRISPQITEINRSATDIVEDDLFIIEDD